MTTVAPPRRPRRTPRDVAAEAAATIERAQAEVDRQREIRDAAAHHLLRNEGWTPVQVYSLIGMSRGLFSRMIVGRESGREGQQIPRVTEPDRVAVEAAAAFAAARAEVEKARATRTKAVEKMLAKGEPNADVARASGLTSARIAQIRKGGR